MLDVLHYLFETDALPSSAEAAEARDSIRHSIYGDLYNKEYKYGGKKTKTLTGDPEIDYPLDDSDIPVPVDPFERSQTTKPYVSPTSFDDASPNPFGGVLDAPLR
jgi:uncharacterized protein (DUF2141 family)